MHRLLFQNVNGFQRSPFLAILSARPMDANVHHEVSTFLMQHLKIVMVFCVGCTIISNATNDSLVAMCLALWEYFRDSKVNGSNTNTFRYIEIVNSFKLFNWPSVAAERQLIARIAIVICYPKLTNIEKSDATASTHNRPIFIKLSISSETCKHQLVCVIHSVIIVQR